MPKTASQASQVKQSLDRHRHRHRHRPTEVVYGRKFWVESYQGVKIWIDRDTMAAFNSTNLGGIGTWDDATKSIIFE
jgi:hypothetical protein